MRWCGVLGCAAALTLATLACPLSAGEASPKVISFHGYPGCIEITNESTRVVLCPEAGGRVLEYSLDGVNALYLEEADTGQPYVPGRRASMSAGRFDIGPENTIPRHEVLWSGRWQAEVLGERAARLTSQQDEATGTQLVREFRLAEVFLPGVLYISFLGAVISAILSAVHAALHAPASQISHNVVVRLLPGITERGKLWSVRLTVMALCVIAYFLSITYV